MQNMRFGGGILFGSWLIASVAGAGLDAVRAEKIDGGKLYEAVRVEPDGRNLVEGVPPRTVVRIGLNPAPGSNIRVELQMPDFDRWNGNFVGLGNGGAAGGINPAIFTGWLKRGYAVASTDMGTAPNSDSGIGNPEVWKDFGYRATHRMTVVAKRMIEVFYGKAPALSYFVGGSTGGQQALQEAQRYPEDYDGILGNVPAHCRAPLHAYFLWNWQILQECPLTPEQNRAVMEAGVECMAGRQIPRLAGKAVADPRCTPEEIETIVALALKKEPSLTPRHAEALRKILNGPRNSAGERIFGGVPPGASILDAAGHLYLFRWAFGSGVDLRKIDFDRGIERYLSLLGPDLNAENPDLSAFAGHGGKLIIISGTADSIVPYHATLDYYERCIGKAGSPEALQEFCRFYLVPGMGHGVGGLSPEPFELLVRWREQGIPPRELLLRRFGEPAIPLYPYPQQTAYDEERGFYPVPGPRGFGI